MYRLDNKNPLGKYKFLLEKNTTRLTFLQHCYMIGLVTIDEYGKFREKAIRRAI